MKHLVEVLKDENEYARRAAVEVLNHLGTAKDIKHLLQVIKDDDWWVRTRAADALGKIGGPRVVDAVIELIRDEDEDVRRAAIEILNQTKDERAVNFLIEATKDKDWWVSERAVDALAEIGSKKAVPALMELLNSENTRSLPTVARALGQDRRHARHRTDGDALLDRPEKEIKVEAIDALARLADDKRADTVRGYIQSAGAAATDDTIQHAAMRAIEDIDSRYSSTAVAAQAKASKMAEPARTLLIDKGDVDPVIKKAEEATAASHEARYLDAQVRRDHRRPLQVHREDRQGRVRHGAAGRGYRRRRTADPQVPEPERVAGRGDDEALRARTALFAQDHAQERHPHLRLPVHARQLRHFDGVLSRRTRWAARSSTRSRCRCRARSSTASTSPTA